MIILLIVGVLAILFALLQGSSIKRISVTDKRIAEIGGHIADGAMAYLKRQYKILAIFVVIFAIILFVLGFIPSATALGWKTAIAFIVGAIFSATAGFCGMKAATSANMRVTEKAKGGSIGVLIRHRIIKFTLISVITGVVRTTVVFWLPTYISQHLGFSAKLSSTIFTVATFIISMTAFIAVFIYERLGRNMDLTILLGFCVSAISFMLVFLIKQPAVNIVFMVLAIMASNSAACMLWSRYCPSLRDTGMVSGATGFLDFMSYVAAAISSTLFANAVSDIGWDWLIIIWFGLMVLGIIVALPYKRKAK